MLKYEMFQFLLLLHSSYMFRPTKALKTNNLFTSQDDLYALYNVIANKI